MKQYDGFFLNGNIISYKPKLINIKPIFYLSKKKKKIFIYNLKKKFNKLKLKPLIEKFQYLLVIILE